MTKWSIVIGIILLLCVAEWIRELFTFKITHYEITSDKLHGLKDERTIVFLSDLHSNRYGKDNSRLLDAIRRQKPDFILIGGDMLVGKKRSSTKIAEDFVEQLTAICQVYYANGNHEQRMKLDSYKYGDKYQEYKLHLEQLGVRFIENNHIDCSWDGSQIQIYGLEIPSTAYKKYRKSAVSKEKIEKLIGQADEHKYQILLAHHPMYMESYIQWGADLVLSGHLHGGVVRIPGLGGVITPQLCLFPKYSGELTVEGDTTVVVSKGLGTHTIKIRFMNPAEVVVLHVRGRKK